MLLQLAKVITRDPARTRLVARRAGIGAALLAALLIGIGIGGGRSAEPSGPAPTPVAAAGQTEPDGSPLTPQTGAPTRTLDATAAADTVAKAFVTAWLNAPVYEDSKRGKRDWVASLAPYVDGATYGAILLSDKAVVPAAADGRPLRVIAVRGVRQTGDVAELRASLSDGSAVVVTATGSMSGWRVSGYRTA